MDLTSLSSNLPRNPSPTADPPPPSDLLMSAFKSAALSVTTLYKTAASEAERSRKTGRTEGYNECLDDLLSLVSRIEHRVDTKTTEVVKQWALSRRRKSGSGGTGGGGGGGKPREDREPSAESETMEPPSQLPPVHPSSSPPREMQPPSMPVFTFRADQHMPPPVEMEDITSPPASPQMLPQRTKGHQPRTGSKRRYGNINDFFELAGLEKFHVGKKGRFQ